MGDIEALAESIKRHGLICPIVISRKNILIAGGRRLEAAKMLGWRSINAIVADNSKELARLEMEVEENIQRRDLTMEEIADASRRIYRLQHPGFFRRFYNGVVSFFKWIFKIEEA